jgi:cobalt-zinc-cadmium efflux system outer membrane protein
MNTKLTTLFIVYVLSLSSWTICSEAKAMPAESKESVRNVSYDSVLTQAFEHSPALKQIQSQLSSQKAEGLKLKTLENPEISVEVRPFSAHSSGAEQEHEVAISQPLKLSNFGSRQRVAELITESSDIESKILVIEFEQQILAAYSKVWALQTRKAYLSSLLDKTETILHKIKKASDAGLVPSSTSKLILAEQKRLKIEHAGIKSEELKALASLNRICGINIPNQNFIEVKLSELPAEIRASNEIPLVQKIRLMSRLSSEQSRLAELDSYPEFSPRIAFDHTADGDDRVILGISFPLPIFDRNQSEQLKAEAEKTSILAKQQYLENGSLQTELDLLLESSKSSLLQAQQLKSEVLPTMEEAYTAAEREVSSGQGTYLQLWQVLSEMRDTQQKYLELWVQSLSQRSELSILTGTSF